MKRLRDCKDLSEYLCWLHGDLAKISNYRGKKLYDLRGRVGDVCRRISEDVSEAQKYKTFAARLDAIEKDMAAFKQISEDAKAQKQNG